MKKILISILFIVIGASFLYFNSNNQLEMVKDKEKTSIKEEIPIKEEITKSEKNNLVSYNGKLKVDGVNLINKYGEIIQLRGISTHGIQWYSKYANKEVFKTLRDEWNANVIRIAMYTEENGYIYNKSLKDKVKKIANIAIDLDMYVVIDWHILSDNNPNIHKEEAKEFFIEMAKEYKDTPNIIFEICNEPNGNVNWDNDIKPYAVDIIDIIRKYTDAIIIVGTGTWSQDVDDAADNPLDYKNIMYACHFYSGTHTKWLRDRIDYARNKGIAIIVSEFGVSNADGNGGVYKEETLNWLNYLNDKNISWINWSLSDKNETSALLIPNTKENDISDENLSESGKFIKSQMKK